MGNDAQILAMTSQKRKSRAKGHPLTPPNSYDRQNCRLLVEGFYRGCFIVFHVEDGIKLGDLQQVVHLLGQVEQF